MVTNINIEIRNDDFTDIVKTYYQELRKHSKPIPKDEERKLLVLAKNGDIDARNKILISNLRFVFDVAKKFRGKGVGIDELISEGNQGMVKAIEKFDMSQDVKFFSYAVWWIKQRMFDALKKARLKTEFEVNSEDFYFGRSENVGEEVLDNETYYDSSDNELDINNGTDKSTLELNEEYMEKRKLVKKLIENLPKKEKMVVCKYFGIGCDREESMDEIAQEMNISPERVRQIKARAIDIMRTEAIDFDIYNFLF